MKKKLYLWKDILILSAIIFSVISIIIQGLYVYRIYSKTIKESLGNNIFEISDGSYTLRIIGEKNSTKSEIKTTDVFSYEMIKNKNYLEIGCGTLLLAGYSPEKQYFYGKVEYDIENTGFGIYKNGKESLYGNISGKEETEEDKKYRREFLRKQCTGYFVLNLKTGDYQGGLSEEQQNRVLSERGAENDMLSAKEFLNKNGELVENYEWIGDWMENYQK